MSSPSQPRPPPKRAEFYGISLILPPRITITHSHCLPNVTPSPGRVYESIEGREDKTANREKADPGRMRRGLTIDQPSTTAPNADGPPQGMPEARGSQGWRSEPR